MNIPQSLPSEGLREDSGNVIKRISRDEQRKPGEDRMSRAEVINWCMHDGPQGLKKKCPFKSKLKNGVITQLHPATCVPTRAATHTNTYVLSHTLTHTCPLISSCFGRAQIC